MVGASVNGWPCLWLTDKQKWLAAKLSHLRRVIEPQASILGWEDEERLAGHWASHELGRSLIDEGSLYLPLTKEIAKYGYSESLSI